jgi:hypothetical protein
MGRDSTTFSRAPTGKSGVTGSAAISFKGAAASAPGYLIMLKPPGRLQHD